MEGYGTVCSCQDPAPLLFVPKPVSQKCYTVNVLKKKSKYSISLSVLKILFVIRAGIHKVLVRKANREDPDHTAYSEAVRSGSALFVLAFTASNYCLKFKNIKGKQCRPRSGCSYSPGQRPQTSKIFKRRTKADNFCCD